MPEIDINTPVSQEVIGSLETLLKNREGLATQLLQIELTKVQLLRDVLGIDTAKTQIFERITSERGLPPDFPVEVDRSTGVIRPMADLPVKLQEEGSAPSSIMAGELTVTKAE
jgi:hypothetical protein